MAQSQALRSQLQLAGSLEASKRLVIALAFAVAMMTTVPAETSGDYRFELAGQPTKTGRTLLVRVRLVHAEDGKLVAGASISRLRFDMGPDGMASMTAPAKVVATVQSGIYEVETRPSMPGKWALGFTLTVPKGPPVEGSLIVTVPK
jgi:YtkA-like